MSTIESQKMISSKEKQKEKPSAASPVRRWRCPLHCLCEKMPSRYAIIALLGCTGIVLSTLTRLSLTIYSHGNADCSFTALLMTFATGLLFDTAVQFFMLAPVALYLTVLSEHFFHGKINTVVSRSLIFLLNAICLFNAVAEVVFWGEFEARYNFIAVDYLAYTTEVLGNIWQSYPIVPILIGILLLATGMTALHLHSCAFKRYLDSQCSLRQRWIFLGGYSLIAILMALFLTIDTHPSFHGNRCNIELSKNGIFCLAAAFRNNQLDYTQFYSTLPVDEVDRLLRQELSKTPCEFLSTKPLDIRRTIRGAGPEKRWNVIVIVEESLSASFTTLTPKAPAGLTPRFNALAKEGLLLKRCFASGTRTVRGLEALQLSLPPTPGQSIVKRQNYDDLPSMGRVFKEHGYHNLFLYGGNGFFDNMNAFFSANGYEIQDENSPNSQPKTFSTIWGNCDGDLFQWALNAADRDDARHQPFHFFLMTTSNHRPYTFPEGTIHAPQKSRSSAVGYSDYALGKFIDAAKGRPWFENTLFVIVADHCHSTSGKTALPLNKYHIPALFYNPKNIPPRAIDTVCSQIDIAPTLFGLLNWSYVSEFYGHSLLQLPTDEGRAFPGTFQTLGWLDGKSGELLSLAPNCINTACRWSLTLPLTLEGDAALSQQQLHRSIAIYQSASTRYTQRLDKKFIQEAKK